MSKDHWFSEFLLRKFVPADGRLYLYDKAEQKQKRKPIKKVCCEEGFTTFSDEQIPPSMKGQGKFLETELSKWERQQSFTVEKLIKDRSIEKITSEEFYELIRFAVWLHHCNPAIRQMLRQGMHKFHLHKMRSYSGKDLDALMHYFGLLLPHEFLRKMLDSMVPLTDLLQSEFLGLALGGAEKSFKVVREQYAWRLEDYKDSELLLCTSDRPVLLAGSQLDSYIGFGTPGVVLHFPLSPDLCLVGCNVEKKYRGAIQFQCKVNNPILAKVNLALVAMKSFNLIIAPDPRLLPSDGTELSSYLPEIIDLGDRFAMGMR